MPADPSGGGAGFITIPLLITLALFAVTLIGIGIKMARERTELERKMAADIAAATDRVRAEVQAVKSFAEMRTAVSERRCAELSEKIADHKLQMAERLANYPTKTEMRDMMATAVEPIMLRLAGVENLIHRALHIGGDGRG